MKNLTIGIVVIVILAGLYAAFNNSENEQDSAVAPEVSENIDAIETGVDDIETELAELELAVANGTVTPEEAAKVQVRLADKLDAVYTKVDQGKGDNLTEEQKQSLAISLDKLKGALLQYQTSLNFVDGEVSKLPESQRPKTGKRRSTPGGSGNSLNISDFVEDTVAEITEDIDEIIEEIIEDDGEVPELENTDVDTDEESNATSTEEDAATSTPEEDDGSGSTETMDVDENSTTSTDTSAQ